MRNFVVQKSELAAIDLRSKLLTGNLNRVCDRVELLVDGEPVANDASFPWEFPIAMPRIMDGRDTVRVDDNLYVAELGERAGRGPNVAVEPHAPHARVSVMDLAGTIHTRFGGDDPVRPGNFFAPHGIWADSRGRWGLVPLDCHSLQKFVRVRG